ncbi:MAG: hypothetical protein KIT72_07485 [Polyangiaceae bacterium]|nr:hypothetical protein [Polyangiaceae bacterium]
MDWLFLLPAQPSEKSDEPLEAPPQPPNRVVRIIPRVNPSGLFTTTGRWEGVVEHIDEGTGEFDVRMVDLLHDEGDDLFMTFSVDDVSREDVPMVKQGAIFYWVVGYYDNVSGQRTRIAELKFRRLPARRSTDLARARERAQATLLKLGG